MCLFLCCQCIVFGCHQGYYISKTSVAWTMFLFTTSEHDLGRSVGFTICSPVGLLTPCGFTTCSKQVLLKQKGVQYVQHQIVRTTSFTQARMLVYQSCVTMCSNRMLLKPLVLHQDWKQCCWNNWLYNLFETHCCYHTCVYNIFKLYDDGTIGFTTCLNIVMM